MKRLGWKGIWTAILAVAVWVAGGWVGFPTIFRIFFMGYVALGLLFFLFLDARAMRLPSRPILAIVTFFLIASAVLTLVGALLPQYDPVIEMQKIWRIQEAAIEQEREKRHKAIAEAAKKVSPEAVLEKAELITRGKQVYTDYECYNCHKIGGRGGVKRRGPALDNIGSLITPEQMQDKILATASWYPEGFEKEYEEQTMPFDYDERITEKELGALIAYLTTLKDPAGKTPKPVFTEE